MRRIATGVIVAFATVFVLATGPAQAAPGDLVTVYRFWSENNRSHFYTADLDERDHILRTYGVNEWRYEGAVYQAYSDPGYPAEVVPLYRFWSDRYKGHVYTVDEAERQEVIDAYDDTEWRFEGIAFYVLPNSFVVSGIPTTPVFRFWSTTYRHHFYTADWNEGNAVIANYDDDIWKFEGYSFRVFDSPVTGEPMINAKDCGDFTNWYEANIWFGYYFPQYGDVAELDADDDMVPCETLVGSP